MNTSPSNHPSFPNDPVEELRRWIDSKFGQTPQERKEAQEYFDRIMSVLNDVTARENRKS